MGKEIIINGKFMSQPVTGVQRYAREILLELDKLLTNSMRVVIAVNKDAENVPTYKNIEIRLIGRHTGNMWEQIDLPFHVIKNRGICISLCNMMPILTPHCVVMHDVNYKVNPQFFSKKFTLWYGLVFALSIRRIRKIITVSEFSKKEILRSFPCIRADIMVIPSAWQHFERTTYAESTLQKYGLENKGYYLAVMSMAPNKNLPWLLHVAKKHAENIFVVCGGVNTKVFGKEYNLNSMPNLKLLGYISDEEVKTLMRDCKAFLFPTFYEGFGLPPMEAMSTGAKAIVSDASCMREIYGNCVYYVDPHDSNVDLDKLLETPVEDANSVLERFNWKKSAEKLYHLIRSVSNE